MPSAKAAWSPFEEPSSPTAELTPKATSPDEPLVTMDDLDALDDEIAIPVEARITELPEPPNDPIARERFERERDQALSAAVRSAVDNGTYFGWSINRRTSVSDRNASQRARPKQTTNVYLYGGLGGEQTNAQQVAGLAIPDARGRPLSDEESSQDSMDHGPDTAYAFFTLEADETRVSSALDKSRMDNLPPHTDSIGRFLEGAGDFTLIVHAKPVDPTEVDRELAATGRQMQLLQNQTARHATDNEGAQDFGADTELDALKKRMTILQEGQNVGAVRVAAVISAPTPRALANIANRVGAIPVPPGYRLREIARSEASAQQLAIPSLSTDSVPAIPATLAHHIVPALTHDDNAGPRKTWNHPFKGRPVEIPSGENGHYLGSYVTPKGVDQPYTPVELSEFDANRSKVIVGEPGTGKTTLVIRDVVGQTTQDENSVVLAIDAANGKDDFSRLLPDLLPRPVLRAAYHKLEGKPGAIPVKINPFRVDPHGENLREKIARAGEYVAFGASGHANDQSHFRRMIESNLTKLYLEAGYDLETGMTADGSHPPPPTLDMLRASCLAELDHAEKEGASDFSRGIRTYVEQQFSLLRNIISDGPDSVAVEEIFTKPERCAGMIADLEGLGESKIPYMCMLLDGLIHYCTKPGSPAATVAIDEFNELIVEGSPIIERLDKIFNQGRSNQIRATLAAAGAKSDENYEFTREGLKIVGRTSSAERTAEYLGKQFSDADSLEAVREMPPYHFAVATGRPVHVFRTPDPSTQPLPHYGLPPITLDQVLPPEIPAHLAQLLGASTPDTINRARTMATARTTTGREHGVISHLNVLHFLTAYAPKSPAATTATRLKDEVKQRYARFRKSGGLSEEGKEIALLTYFSAANLMTSLDEGYRSRITNSRVLWEQIAERTLSSLGLAANPDLAPDARSTIHRATGSLAMQQFTRDELEQLSSKEEGERKRIQGKVDRRINRYASYFPAEFRRNLAAAPIVVPDVPGTPLSSDPDEAAQQLKEVWVSLGGNEGLFESLLNTSAPMMAAKDPGTSQHQVSWKLVDGQLHPDQKGTDEIVSRFRKWAGEYLKIPGTTPTTSEQVSEAPVSGEQAPKTGGEQGRRLPDPTQNSLPLVAHLGPHATAHKAAHGYRRAA